MLVRSPVHPVSQETSYICSPKMLHSVAEKGADPLEATRLANIFVVAGEGQAPFRTGS